MLRQAGELEPNNKAIRDEINNAQALIRCNDEIEKATTKGDYRTVSKSWSPQIFFAQVIWGMKLKSREKLECRVILKE